MELQQYIDSMTRLAKSDSDLGGEGHERSQNVDKIVPEDVCHHARLLALQRWLIPKVELLNSWRVNVDARAQARQSCLPKAHLVVSEVSFAAHVSVAFHKLVSYHECP